MCTELLNRALEVKQKDVSAVEDHTYNANHTYRATKGGKGTPQPKWDDKKEYK